MNSKARGIRSFSVKSCIFFGLLTKNKAKTIALEGWSTTSSSLYYPSTLTYYNIHTVTLAVPMSLSHTFDTDPSGIQERKIKVNCVSHSKLDTNWEDLRLTFSPGDLQGCAPEPLFRTHCTPVTVWPLPTLPPLSTLLITLLCVDLINDNNKKTNLEGIRSLK